MGNIAVITVILCLISCVIYYLKIKKKRKKQGCNESCIHCPFYDKCSIEEKEIK